MDLCSILMVRHFQTLQFLMPVRTPIRILWKLGSIRTMIYWSKFFDKIYFSKYSQETQK